MRLALGLLACDSTICPSAALAMGVPSTWAAGVSGVITMTDWRVIRGLTITVSVVFAPSVNRRPITG